MEAVEPNKERELEIAELLTKYKMAINNKKKRTLMNLNEKAFQSYELGLIISRSCKDLDLDGAFVAYSKAKQSGVFPNSDSFANLLSLTAGLGEQGNGQAQRREKEPPHNLLAALEVYEGMQLNKLQPSESAYTALIRCCCINNQPAKAMQFYRDLQDLNIDPKLRTFTSLLAAFSRMEGGGEANITNCFTIYNELKDKYNITPSEKEYTSVLKVCLHSRDARFYKVLESFMDDVPIPETNEFRNVLKDWFSCCIQSDNNNDNNDSCANYNIVQSGVNNSGVITVNQEVLLSLDVEEEFRLELLAQLEAFAVVKDDNRKVKINNKVREQQSLTLKRILNPGLAHNKQTQQPLEQSMNNDSDGNSIHMVADSIVTTIDSSSVEQQQQQQQVCCVDRDFVHVTTNNESIAVCDDGRDITAHNDDSSNDKIVSSEIVNNKDSSSSSYQRSTTTTYSRVEVWNKFKEWLANKQSIGSQSQDHQLIQQYNDSNVSNSSSNNNSDNNNSQDNSCNNPNTIASNNIYDNSNISNNSNHSNSSSFDIVIDGANVGYFKQNYNGAPIHVNYAQIDRMISHLRNLGHRPLLILHCRHVSPTMVPHAAAQEIVQRWQDSGDMYVTPRGYNDDWFWLYAAVRYRCKVITNDEMRDHHFQLLSPKGFNRWRERNRVLFTFGVWQDEQIRQQERSILVIQPQQHSTESTTSRSSSSIPGNNSLVNARNIDSSSDEDDSYYDSCDYEDEGEISYNEEEEDINNNNNNDNNNSNNGSSKDFVCENGSKLYSNYHCHNSSSSKNGSGKRYNRKIALRWPSVYSYCIQHVVSERFDGYYCPPIPTTSISITTTTTITTSNTNTMTDTGNIASLSTENNVHNTSNSSSSSNTFSTTEWLCIYRPKTTTTNSNNCASECDSAMLVSTVTSNNDQNTDTGGTMYKISGEKRKLEE